MHLTRADDLLRRLKQSRLDNSRELREEVLDPSLLMWDLHRRLHVDRLPSTCTVVQFCLHGARKGESRFWLHLERPEVDVCLTPSGFEVDLTVESDLRTFTEVWMGTRGLEQAQREQSVRLHGSAQLKRDFPSWLKLSVFADA